MKPISSVKNEHIKILRSLKTKKGRAENGLFLAEGEKCAGEALRFMPQNIKYMISAGNRYPELIKTSQSLGIQVYDVSEDIMNAICDLKTPQGIAAAVIPPCYEEIFGGFIVMLDDLQDPQNVGTIIRTADAAGCSCVVMSGECADCFSPKAVRASMGSVFHIPLIKADLSEYINKLKALGYDIATSGLGGETEYKFDWNKTCLVIGNEARGISEGIKHMASKHIKIPMYGKAESLNAAVAAGILIYKIRT